MIPFIFAVQNNCWAPISHTQYCKIVCLIWDLGTLAILNVHCLIYHHQSSHSAQPPHSGPTGVKWLSFGHPLCTVVCLFDLRFGKSQRWHGLIYHHQNSHSAQPLHSGWYIIMRAAIVHQSPPHITVVQRGSSCFFGAPCCLFGFYGVWALWPSWMPIAW